MNEETFLKKTPQMFIFRNIFKITLINNHLWYKSEKN